MQSTHAGPQTPPRTLFDKVWANHVVVAREVGPSLMYIDRHIMHDGSFHAFRQLQARKLTVRRPGQVFAVPDHYVPTRGRLVSDAASPEIAAMLTQFEQNMEWSAVRHFSLQDHRQGIVHVVGPEQGLTLPGAMLVCTDSHTSTHGALGAIAFGIGQSESVHVMSTQTLWQAKPRTLRIALNGVRPAGVSAKDVVLAIIARIGADGAVGHAIEFSGEVIRAMSIDERLTVCNMAIEAGARCGMIAPDDTTFEYLHGLPHSPHGKNWDAALARWKELPGDEGSTFDREVSLDARQFAPMVTWGTSPDAALPITAVVPDPLSMADTQTRAAASAALLYMGLTPGMALTTIAIDRVFIGSCTNSRLSDLRAAADILRGRRARVPGMVVPGSGLVKAAAEAEGLDRVFIDAGLEWREPGCSMCAAMNGDVAPPGVRMASTSNRNFVGRQGPGSRTHLMSPAMAAAAALTGHLTDVREWMRA